MAVKRKDLSKTLSMRLKTLRDALGLSKTAFAKNAGVDVAHYSRIEDGITLPGILTIANICDTFNISPSFLLGFKVGEGQEDGRETTRKKVATA